MDSALVVILAAAAVALVAYGAVILSRRSPAALPERAARQDDVVDRPAGPDAEPMDADPQARLRPEAPRRA
jgi:hypothetical protein